VFLLLKNLKKSTSKTLTVTKSAKTSFIKKVSFAIQNIVILSFFANEINTKYKPNE